MPSSVVSSSSTGSQSSARDLIDQVPWRRTNEISKGLFVGSLDAARSLRFLQEKKITAVLSICSDFVPAEDRTLGIVHYRIPIPDETFTDLLVHLPAACAFISAALAQGRNVLVHSLRGQNRAPAVIAAYLMQLHRIDAAAALERVRTEHEPTWLLPGFHEQLVLFALCGFCPGPGVPYYDSWKACSLNSSCR